MEGVRIYSVLHNRSKPLKADETKKLATTAKKMAGYHLVVPVEVSTGEEEGKTRRQSLQTRKTQLGRRRMKETLLRCLETYRNTNIPYRGVANRHCQREREKTPAAALHLEVLR